MTIPNEQHAEARRLSRRHFLGVLGAAAAGTVVAGCANAAPVAVLEPTTASASVEAAKPGPRPKVAVAQAMTYDRTEVRKQVRQLLDLLGGLKGVVKSRDRVAIKVNLTGGVGTQPLPGVAAIDSYITHPEVVRALAEAVKEAGARQVTLVESVYEWASYKEWGYEDLAAELGLKLVDLNMTDPYKDFAKTPVGKDSFVYPDFTFNHILEETDVFMSVPKMKCHYSAGITLSMKNLVGLVPARFYRLELQHNHRSALHGPDDDFKTRLPRVIVDLNRARPIHFALIDGIKSTEGGEGPWIGTMRANEPHMLIAGIDPLATDAVATAAMSFDPTAPSMAAPFVRSDNHFNLAAQLGLGTNRLSDIDVLGAPIDDVKVKFRTA